MSWQNDIIHFCNKYNIPLEYLAATLNEPKVIPMIRGKAFEFSVYKKLRELLDQSTWDVQKNVMNAQLGIHDEDVTIIHKESQKTFGGECKLAGKGLFKIDTKGNVQINIKCMRSRTLGTAMVKKLAPKYGIPVDVLSIHNDQYLPSDFDLVITSIGNAFYRTDENKLMHWGPSREEVDWLKFLCDSNNEDKLQELTFNKIYVIPSNGLTIQKNGYQTCTRRMCNNKNDCGFIPNYPTLIFKEGSRSPVNGWFQLSEVGIVLKSLLN